MVIGLGCAQGSGVNSAFCRKCAQHKVDVAGSRCVYIAVNAESEYMQSGGVISICCGREADKV
jgi:hypothetical protein